MPRDFEVFRVFSRLSPLVYVEISVSSANLSMSFKYTLANSGLILIQAKSLGIRREKTLKTSKSLGISGV